MINIEIYMPDGSLKCDPIKVEARTAREAMEALKLHKDFDPKYNGDRYLSEVKGVNQLEDLDIPWVGSELVVNVQEVLSPRQLTGAGDKPFLRIVIGVVIIVAAYYLGPAGSSIIGKEFGWFMASMGAGLVLGGLIQMLTKKPETDQDKDKGNNIATRYPNTVKSGTPIPLILGEHRAGGHVFSVNVHTHNGQPPRRLYQYARNMWDNIVTYDSWTTLYTPKDHGAVWNPYGVPGSNGGAGWHGGGGPDDDHTLGIINQN